MFFMILISFVSALVFLAFFEAIPPMLACRFAADRKPRAATFFWVALVLLYGSGGPVALLCGLVGTAPVALTHIQLLTRNRGRFSWFEFRGDLKNFFVNLTRQIHEGMRRLLR